MNWKLTDQTIQAHPTSSADRPDYSWLLVRHTEDCNLEVITRRLPEGTVACTARANRVKNQVTLFYDPNRDQIEFSDSAECFCLLEGELHNQAELRKTFFDDLGAEWNDAELVRLAYRKWKLDFTRQVRGRCSILIWDPASEVFIGARDRLGRISLFFSNSNHEAAFSPSIRTLLDGLGLPRNPNREAIALSLGNIYLDPLETYFEGIYRVPASHFIQIRSAQIHTEKYWEAAPPGTPDDQMREADFETFDQLFEQAVQRYTSLGKPGLFLSGGLDSVSIAAVATDLARQGKGELPIALSIAFPDPQSNEESRQRSVAAQLRLDQVILPFVEAAGQVGLIDSTLRLSTELDTPAQNPWLAIYHNLAVQGKQRGCEVILTGAGGDDWMTVNTAYMSDLMRELRFIQAAQFARSLMKSYNLPRRAMLKFSLWDSGLRPLLGLFARQTLKRISPGAARKFRRERQMKIKLSSLPDWAAPEPELRVNLVRKLQAAVEQELDKPEPEKPYGFYNTTAISAAFYKPATSMEQEENSQIGRQLGLIYGHPFWDAELIEFLCRVPPRLLIVDGREKSIVRKTIARRFPDLGFEKQKKVMASNFYFSNLVAGGNLALKRIGGLQYLEKLGIISSFDGGRIYSAILSNPDYRIAFQAWELINFEAWLQHQFH